MLIVVSGAVLGGNLYLHQSHVTDAAGASRPVYVWGFPFPSYEEYNPEPGERLFTALLNLPFNLAILWLAAWASERIARRSDAADHAAEP